MLPAQFKNGWEEYAEDLCFINSTYVVHDYGAIPSVAIRASTRIKYVAAPCARARTHRLQLLPMGTDRVGHSSVLVLRTTRVVEVAVITIG